MRIEAVRVTSDCFQKKWFRKEKKIGELEEIQYELYILKGSIEEVSKNSFF